MLKFFDKDSGKSIKSKIVKSGVIVATTGTILFGVLFGGQIYDSAESVYAKSKDKVVATYQDVRTSIKDVKLSLQDTSEKWASKIELRRQDKAKKVENEKAKSATTENGSTVDISLGVMEIAGKILPQKSVRNTKTIEKLPEQEITKTVASAENKINLTSNLSLGAMDMSGKIVPNKNTKIIEKSAGLQSVVSAENKAEIKTEGSIVRTKTVSIKETSTSQGEVDSFKINKVSIENSANDEELKENPVNTSQNLSDVPINEFDEKTPTKVQEIEEKSAGLETETALVIIENKVEMTAEDSVVRTRTVSFKETSTSQGEIVSSDVTKVSNSESANDKELMATFKAISYDFKEASKAGAEKVGEETPVIETASEELAERTVESNGTYDFSLTQFDKQYSIKDFCVEQYKSEFLSQIIRKKAKFPGLRYIDENGVTTNGTITSTQFLTLFDEYQKNSASVFAFGGTTFTFGKNGNLLTTTKDGKVVSDVMGNYLDSVNFKLGANVLTAKSSDYNPTPLFPVTINPQIISSGIQNNFNNNIQTYYNLKAGYNFPVSKTSHSSVMAIVFGAKDYTTGKSVISTGLQGNVEYFVDNGLLAFSGGVGYSNKNTISMNLLAKYILSSEQNTYEFFAGIDALKNLSSQKSSVETRFGVSINFDYNLIKNRTVRNDFDMTGNYASNYDLNNPNKKLEKTVGGQTPTNPNGPTINPPFDDGLGGNGRGMELGQ